MVNRLLVFSHGFGVRIGYKDLLPDVAAAFPKMHSILFDYNEFDKSTNTLTIRPLHEQAKILTKKIEQVRGEFPTAEINLMCHSQGCLVAALAMPVNINRTIFLAPPVDSAKNGIIELLKSRQGASYSPNGMSILPRRDGSITHIPAAYWSDRAAVGGMLEKYKEFVPKNNVYIVRATEDEVIGNTDLSSLGVQVHDIASDHNFTGSARAKLINYLQSIL